MSDNLTKVTITVERPDGVSIEIEKKYGDEWVALARGMQALFSLHQFDGGLENLIAEALQQTTKRFERNAGGSRG